MTWDLLLLVSMLLAVARAGEVVLLDTSTMTSDLTGWDYTPNGWTDVSTHDANQNEIRAIQVCAIRKPNQNNWIRTPFLDVANANGVFIEMSFTIRSCIDLKYISSCKETFNLYYLEAESDETGQDKTMNELRYTKIDTVAAEERFGPGDNKGVVNTERRMIGPFKSRGIYVAFQDTGACMSLLRVKIYYKTCDEVVRNLARFPQTTTGSDVITLIPVQGQCVMDSAWTIDNKGPILRCNSEGKWSLPNGSCRCREGYEPNHESTQCQECPVGQYKSSMGNMPCATCPDNSISVKRSSTICICSANYYRSSSDSPHSPCTKAPSRPMGLNARVNETTVILSWREPVFNGGRVDVTYSVSCQECDSTFSLCNDCSTGVDYYPMQSKIDDTTVRITDLSPHTHYKFKVYSRNGVSDVTRRPKKYSIITLQTNEAAPSTIDRVHVVKVTTNSVTLSWQPPLRANGDTVEYEILYSSSSSNHARIVRSNKTKETTITLPNLPPNTAFMAQVRARNAAGYGAYSPPTRFTTTTNGPSLVTVSELEFQYEEEKPRNDGVNTDGGSQIHLVVGIAVACSLIILVIVALLFICEKKRKPVKVPVIMRDYPAFMNTLDMVTTGTRRTYVDPSTYEDPEEAVHEFAHEIDSAFIKIEQVIGAGEFGEVCKGILRPPTPVGEDKPFAMSPQTRTVVAIKTLKSGYSQQQKRDFLAEASIMGQFNHPNVIRLEGVVTKNRPFMIVTEFMENGSLDRFLLDSVTPPPITQLVEMLRDIACGMRYLSEMGYVHRDLAARNVLVDSNLTCKVSDFGLSRELGIDTEEPMYTTRGGMIPIRWTAPEAITKREFTSASDVWSYGIVIWEVLSKGERPYWEVSNQDVLHCVECGYRLPPPPFCPLVLHSIMMDCWDTLRTERPTFTDLMVSMDNCLRDPQNLQNTINNVPFHQQLDCIPEPLDISSLGQWLKGMNMCHVKENMLRHGCVTAEQITRLNSSQLNLMGVYDKHEQTVLLEGAKILQQSLEDVQNMGVAV